VIETAISFASMDSATVTVCDSQLGFAIRVDSTRVFCGYSSQILEYLRLGSGRVRPQVGKVGSGRTTIRDTRSI